MQARIAITGLELMSEEKTEGIKVVDKRRFTEEGEAKADNDLEPSFVSDSVDKVKQSGSSEEGQQADAKIQDTGSAGGNSQDMGAETVDFSSFIVSLATQFSDDAWGDSRSLHWSALNEFKCGTANNRYCCSAGRENKR